MTFVSPLPGETSRVVMLPDPAGLQKYGLPHIIRHNTKDGCFDENMAAMRTNW